MSIINDIKFNYLNKLFKHFQKSLILVQQPVVIVVLF